jgi:integrase
MAKKKEEKLPPKVRKRGNGYTYRYDVPIVKADGSPGRKQAETSQYPTPQEAYKAGVLIEAQLIQGTYVDEDNALFSDWAPTILTYHARLKGLRMSTVDTYESLLHHAYAYFVGKRAKDITHGQYQDFLFWLQDERKLSPSSINSIHAIVSSLYKQAVKRGQFATSPCKGAVLPKPAEQDDDTLPNYLEKDQLAALIRAAKENADTAARPRDAFAWRQFGRILFILAHTGMRIGELSALEADKIDTQKLTIKIAATLYDKRGLRNYHIGPPKTKESRRVIDISKRVADVFEAQLKDLKAFKLLSGPKYHVKRSFVFAMPTVQLPGYPVSPAKVNDMLAEALTAAGLPPELITAHGLRHTFTSLSAEAGVTLDDIRRQLGHASDEMTRRVYLHVTEARRRANVDKLDALLGDLL